MTMSNNGFSKLIEETGELQQVSGKILAYGMAADHPDGKGALDNRFVEEAGDTVAAINFVADKYGSGIGDRIAKIAAEKLALFKQWDEG